MINLIANELNNKGFQVKLNKNSIEVSLKNRKVSSLEVDYALLNDYDGLYMLVNANNSVLVVVK